MAVDGATGGFGEVPAGDLVDSVVTGSVGLGCGDYDFKEEAPKSFTLQSADDIKPTLKQALSGFAAWAVSSWSSLPDGGAIGLPYPGSQPEEW